MSSESDDDFDQAPAIKEPMTVKESAPVEKKQKRTKKERTPAQQEAFKKALTILKEKREGKKKDEEDRLAKASEEEKQRILKEKYEKAKNHHRKLPPAPSYVTTGDLEKFKLDLLNAIPKYEKPEVVEKPVEKPKPAPVSKEPDVPVIKKPIVEKKIQKQLTGHELLDKLFFS